MLSRNSYAKHNSIWYFAGLVGLAAWLYWPSLSFWAVNDDFAYLLASVPPDHGNNHAQIYTTFRPLERLVIWLNLRFFGDDSLVFSQIISLIGFLLCLWCVYDLSRFCCRRARWTPWIAAMFFACSPISVASVIQIDTLSQQYASVFTLLSCRFLLKSATIWPGLLAMFLAMLSKETAFGVLAALPAAALLLQAPQPRASRKKLFATYAGAAALFGIYLLLRIILKIPFNYPGHHRYDFSFSPQHLVKNGIFFFGNLVYMGTSLDIFPSIHSVRLLISIAFTVVIALILGIGMRNLLQSPFSPRPFLGLILLMMAGFFPVGLLKSVSELYCYSAVPFWAMIVGMLAGQTLERFGDIMRSRRILSIAFMAYTLLLCSWMLRGSREKLAFRAELSRKSRQYFAETAAFLNTLPDEPALLCWNEPSLASQPRYSVFIMPDNYLLNYEVVHFAAYVLGKPIRMPTADMKNYRCDYEIRLAHDKLAFAPSQFSNDSR